MSFAAVAAGVAAATPAVVAAIGAVGTGVAVYGQYQSGQAAEEAGDYNSRLQRRRADQQREVMRTNIARQKEDKSRYMAGVDVSQAASGVLADTGSPVVMRSEIEGRLDERISSYAQQALSSEAYMRSQAQMTKFAGEQAADASKLAMGGTILGGIGKMGSTYYKSQQLTKPR